jgi:hypothetical protein
MGMKVQKFVVSIIESERGWGQKVDDVFHFDTDKEARDWAKLYNMKYNPPGPTPDWYMYASYDGMAMVDENKVNPAHPIELDPIATTELIE